MNMAIDLTPRYHGNGFIQVSLNPTTRVHIYVPDLPREFKRVANARIHDHAFEFVSTVLVGYLRHTKYSVRPGVKGDHGFWMVDKEAQGEPLTKVGYCDCTMKKHSGIMAGGSYKFGGPLNFHDTWADEFTVTVMSKVGHTYLYSPKIVGLHDPVKLDDAFSDQPPVEMMNEYMRKALALVANKYD